MDTKKIGAFLKQCRKEKNLTQELIKEIRNQEKQQKIGILDKKINLISCNIAMKITAEVNRLKRAEEQQLGSGFQNSEP